MIEITETAANILKRSQVEGKVIRMFLPSPPNPITGAEWAMALGDPEKDDVIFEDRGIKIHMNPLEAEILRETVIDYVNDDRGTGFVIRGPEDEVAGCGSCPNADACDHDAGSCDHDHGNEGCSCEHEGDEGY
jgi:iron-sulfur cluster assembly protein